jgi:hypothetical protein
VEFPVPEHPAKRHGQDSWIDGGQVLTQPEIIAIIKKKEDDKKAKEEAKKQKKEEREEKKVQTKIQAELQKGKKEQEKKAKEEVKRQKEEEKKTKAEAKKQKAAEGEQKKRKRESPSPVADPAPQLAKLSGEDADIPSAKRSRRENAGKKTEDSDYVEPVHPPPPAAAMEAVDHHPPPPADAVEPVHAPIVRFRVKKNILKKHDQHQMTEY